MSSNDNIKFFRIRGDLYARKSHIDNIDVSGLKESDRDLVRSVLSRPKNWPHLASARPTARERRISEAVATIAYRVVGDNVEYAVSFKNPKDTHRPRSSREAARGRFLANRRGKAVIQLNMTPGLSRREMQQCIIKDILASPSTPTIYRDRWVNEMFGL